MLSSDKMDRSFRNVRLFAEAAGGTPDKFFETLDVLVKSDRDYLYRSITIHIGYNYGYMDYRVELTWEDDTSQVDYRELGLHGQYSTNFQEFFFSNDTLSFKDGDNEISIFITK